jgi:hypothetical protein
MAVTGELVAGTDNVSEFEKKVRTKKNTNPYAKKTPAYDDGKYLGNLTQEEIRDYQEKQKEKKNTRSNTRTKFKASGGRVNLRGGGMCKKGMNKNAYGKNS